MDRPDGLDDRSIVDGLRRSDPASFELLLERYRSRARRWIARRVFDPDEVEDVLQEVFLSAWRAGPRLRPDTVLPAWLKTVAENACRKRARRRIRKPAVPVGLEPPGAPSDDPPDVASSVAVAQALGQMPEREERVLTLLYRDELSLRQTAAALDVSSDAAKSLAARARRRFRSQFAGWFEGAAGALVVLGDAWETLGERLGKPVRTVATATAAAVAAASVAASVSRPPQPLPPPTPAAAVAEAAGDVTGPGGFTLAAVPEADVPAEPPSVPTSRVTDAPAAPAAQDPDAPAQDGSSGETAASQATGPDVGMGGAEACPPEEPTADEDAGTDLDDAPPCAAETPAPTGSPGPAPGPAPGTEDVPVPDAHTSLP